MNAKILERSILSMNRAGRKTCTDGGASTSRGTVVSHLSDNTRFIFAELCNAGNGEINNLQFPTPALSGHEAGGSCTSTERGRKRVRRREREKTRCVQQPRLLQGRPVTMARVMIACPRLIISPPS